MSNAPYSPPPPAPVHRDPALAPEPIDYDRVPETGVRKVLDAYEERSLQRVRWGSVIAGVFLAAGTQILLALLGMAVGITAVEPRSPTAFQGLGLGAGIWMAVSSLIALFVGGFAAAKLSGSIRRSHGVLAGILVWATSLVLAVLLVGSSAGLALSGMPNMPGPYGSRGPSTMMDLQRTPEQSAREALMDKGDMTRVAWGAFAGACISLIAAIIGGAVGSVGMAATRGPRERRRSEEEDAWRRARERDREAMEREREREAIERDVRVR